MIPAVDYLNALRVRARFSRDLDSLLTPFDTVVTPARATVAPPLDRPFREYAPGANAETMAAPPTPPGCRTVRAQRLRRRGPADGAEPRRPAFAEDRLLAVAAAYQAETDWHARRPAAFA